MNVAIYKKWPTIGSSRALVRERLCLLFSIAIAAAAIVRDWEVSGRRWISKQTDEALVIPRSAGLVAVPSAILWT
jgi:hypothetical protein